MTRKMPRKSPGTERQVAAYIRVSTQRQKTEGDSLEAQQNEINRYLKNREQFKGWTIKSIRPYIDAGRSAKNQNRPELQKLRADIAKGEIDTVVCFKLDRITRSILDFADLWDFFKKHGVEFISLNEDVDSSTAMGRAMLAIIMVFAQLEREITGERTLATMQDRLSRGLWNGGCLYGYIPDPKGSGKLIPDSEWSKIIQEKFFDALERLGSAGAVQRELSEKWKITVPKRKARSGRTLGGDFFTKQQVVRILRNPIYIGRITWGDMVRDDCHEPIISKDQFDRVQRILDGTTKHRTNRRKSRGRGYPLRGLVRCGCGAMMTPKGAHGRNAKYHYYECTRKNHVGPTGCRALGIPAEPLEEAVVARVAELGTNETARRQVISEALKQIDASAHAADQEAQSVRSRLTTVKAEIGRLVAVLKEMGTGGLDGIKDELTRLEREKGELQARLEELQQQKTPVDQILTLAKTFIENWPGVGELIREATGDERRGILEQYVEVVQMTPTGPDGKSGTYALRLFPEATPDRDTHGGVEPGENHRANDDPVLTESSLVRKVDEKAPRARHFRFLSGKSPAA
jgi:DNA invertase Pin-like site-specific DNA recombinase